MANVKKILNAEKCSLSFRNIEYSARVFGDFGKNKLIVLVGLGIMQIRKVFREKVDKAVSGIRKEAVQRVSNENKQYFEFFEMNLNAGVDLAELSEDENCGFFVENFMYWFVSFGKSVANSERFAEGLSEENEEFWGCLCERLGINVIVDSVTGGYCFGIPGNFPVFYVRKDCNEYFLMLGADLLNSNVKQIYNSLIAGNLANQLLKLKNKIINAEKRQKFIEIIEQLLPHLILSPEIHSYLAELKSRQCNHEYYYLYKPLCKNLHCSLCLFEFCKRFPPSEMICQCEEPLSPKNFSELSQFFIKSNKKQLRSTMFNTSNLPKLSHLAQSFIKSQNHNYQEENSTNCLICQSIIPSNYLFKICSNHQQCRQCLISDQKKCQYCKKEYSHQERQKLLSLI